jgi:hypothetical protein
MGRHYRQPAGGRHRLGLPGLVHCRLNEQVRNYLEAARPGFFSLFRDPSRHTVASLTRSGQRPRLAFVLIASM